MAIRKTLFLAIGLGIFAYFAFSPEKRHSDSIVVALEYLTLEKLTAAMLFIICGKLLVGATKRFLDRQ